MTYIARLRSIYRRYIHVPALDQAIYFVLDTLTNWYSSLCGYSFPKNYIRRWKLDILLGLYEPETARLFEKIIKPGMVIVDIGAHIGYFTRLFSKLVGATGRVYAFEADPENYSLLQKNTHRLRNVKLFPLAVTDQHGTIDFYHYPDKAGCHSTLPNVPLDYKKERITVPADSLDSLLKTEGVKSVDLVKMDIEGGEGAALRGMEKTLAKNTSLMMVIEFAPAWIRATRVTPLSFLQNIADHGFKIFAIKGLELIPLVPETEASYETLIPKTPTAFNEFINIYCTK
ncbi:MAG: FkbM family methyltransferase [Candidatus Magasanikbacteria bacterium]|nr:FkbM family methyltransferase [Candidatus Magasanikbacteria bacterium]